MRDDQTLGAIGSMNLNMNTELWSRLMHTTLLLKTIILGMLSRKLCHLVRARDSGWIVAYFVSVSEESAAALRLGFEEGKISADLESNLKTHLCEGDKQT